MAEKKKTSFQASYNPWAAMEERGIGPYAKTGKESKSAPKPKPKKKKSYWESFSDTIGGGFKGVGDYLRGVKRGK